MTHSEGFCTVEFVTSSFIENALSLAFKAPESVDWVWKKISNSQGKNNYLKKYNQQNRKLHYPDKNNRSYKKYSQ